MSRSLIIAAALSFTALVAGAANADDREVEMQEFPVSTHGVDFNKPSDVRMLYRRINVAAEAVCKSAASDPMTANADAACARKAVSDAVRDINAPSLSALDGQSNRAPAYAQRNDDRRAN